MILCLGTTPAVGRTMVFSRLRLDAVNRAISADNHAAGKAVNVARVLHTLGREHLAIGFAGGQTGAIMLADLDRAGVKHDFIQVDRPTRMCITLVDRCTGTATELVEEAGALPPRAYDAMIDKLASLLPRAKMLVVAGALPQGCDPSFYARCVSLAEPNVPVILDAVGSPLLAALPERPLVVKSNQSEIARTLGVQIESEAALNDAMKQLTQRGAKWVVVTRGQLSTLITDGQSFWQVNTPSVKAVSTIGSGDAFAAGLASALSSGQHVPEACVLAVACGAANALTPYAGHLHSDDAEALAAQVKVEPM